MKTSHHLTLVFLGLLSAILLGTTPVHAAPGDVDSLDANVVGASVWCTAVQTDGKTIIGGPFSSVLGQPRNYIARLNADGTLDASFNPNLNNNVRSVAVQADGQILLGGSFTSVGGITRNRIARLAANGTLDAGFNPNVNTVPPGWVNTVAVQVDGQILLGGANFASVGGTTRSGIARVAANGTLDAGFYPNANSSAYIYSVAVQADGQILLGGIFSSMGGTARNKFARLLNDPATQTLSATDTSQVIWTRGGSAPEITQVTVEQSTDSGTTWTNLGSATRIGTTANWRLTGLNLPPSVQLRARGRSSGGENNGSSGLIEQVASFSGLLPAPGIDVTQASQLYDGISHVAFGFELVGSSTPLTFTINNPGSADLTNLVVTVDGANSGDFMVSALSATSIPVGAGTSTFTVTFSPTASGAKTAALHIASNVTGTQNPFDIILTGTGLNNAPTLSDIANLTINEDEDTGARAFTIGDVETATASLTVSSSSSSTTLVPTANIVLGGSGATRTVTVTPAANQFGTATITVSVSDGSASANDTFLLTVNPVNDAPTISNITDQSIGVNTLTTSLPFTVGDMDTPVAALSVSGTSSNQALVPDGNLFFGGSEANRTVTVVPEANQSGTVTISVSVSDGALTVTDTFVLTVLAPDIAVEQPFNNNLTDGGTKSFGNVAVGANSSLNFFIKNTGNANLTGLTISQDGPDAGMFTVTANPTAPVSGPNGTTAFTVRFAPTSVGLKTAALHIASNDPDESPFDITLTGGPPAEPEIAVERSGVNIADGGSVGFVTATVGSLADVVFTVRNTGSAPLALSGTPVVAVGGTDAALFSVISPPASAVGAGDSTTFIVRYTPLDSSPKTATLSLANNDTDEQPFDLNLTGAVLSFTTDTDGDGFSDAAELQMAALGYDWQVSQTALVNTFTSNANGLGYYTAAQVQALNLDVPLIQRDGLGQFKLTLGMKKSTDLVLFNPFPMNQPGMTTTINGEGKLEIQFTVPDNAAFFRLQAQ
jgi:uncharacterized delta-60 repeat protein